MNINYFWTTISITFYWCLSALILDSGLRTEKVKFEDKCIVLQRFIEFQLRASLSRETGFGFSVSTSIILTKNAEWTASLIASAAKISITFGVLG